MWTTAPLLDNSVVCRNSCGLWTGRALEGLLGWVVVERCWHMRPLFQLVILQMKFLRDEETILPWFETLWHTTTAERKQAAEKPNSYLGYFPPVKTIKKVVGAPLIRVGLQCRLHARRPRYPNPLLFVIPPVPVKAGEWNYEKGMGIKRNKVSHQPFECQISQENKVSTNNVQINWQINWSVYTDQCEGTHSSTAAKSCSRSPPFM